MCKFSQPIWRKIQTEIVQHEEKNIECRNSTHVAIANIRTVSSNCLRLKRRERFVEVLNMKIAALVLPR